MAGDIQVSGGCLDVKVCSLEERWRLRGSPGGVLSSERRAGRTRELTSQQSGGVPKEPVGLVCLGSVPWPRRKHCRSLELAMRR